VRRRLLDLLTLLSLLLCVAVCGLWVRSSLVGEAVWSSTVRAGHDGRLHRRFWRATSGGGALDVYCVRGETDQRQFAGLFPVGTERGRLVLGEPERQAVGRGVAGPWRFGLRFSPQDAMGYLRGPAGRQVWMGRSWRLALPYWLVATVTATPPALWLARRRGRRRRARIARGLCPTCGYDLTGNRSGVCPECGTKRRQVGAAMR
jgi:hypothetical protein